MTARNRPIRTGSFAFGSPLVSTFCFIALCLKQQLMAELSSWITEHQLKQADAAQVLMVSRPRVSDVVNQKTAKFTIDTLVEMLSRVGKPVRLAVG